MLLYISISLCKYFGHLHVDRQKVIHIYECMCVCVRVCLHVCMRINISLFPRLSISLHKVRFQVDGSPNIGPIRRFMQAEMDDKAPSIYSTRSEFCAAKHSASQLAACHLTAEQHNQIIRVQLQHIQYIEITCCSVYMTQAATCVWVTHV